MPGASALPGCIASHAASLKPRLGATSSASERLWGARDARALASDDDALDAARGLRAEAGYGMSLFGDQFTGTTNLDVMRREVANDDTKHAVMLRRAVCW